jgi:hypothetical protein
MKVSPTLQLITIVGHPQHCVLLPIANDGRGPYPPSVVYVISTARTVSNPARAQDIRRQWKRRLLSLAGWCSPAASPEVPHACVRQPPNDCNPLSYWANRIRIFGFF